MPFFSKKFKLGLDIGSSLIKVCLPRRNGRPMVLSLETPKGMVSKGVLLDAGDFGDSLRPWIKKHQLDYHSVVAALPANTLVLRHIQVPKLNNRETAEAIEWEARRVLPFAVEEAQIDWINQGTVHNDQEEMQNILLVAVRDTIVEKYAQAIKDAGLRLVALDIAPLALGRWLLKDASGSSLLIDIGAENTQVHFFVATRLIFSRSFTVGGAEATKAIAAVNDLPFDKAELKKLRGDYSEDSLDSWHRELGRELQRSLEFYQNNYSQEAANFNRVLLTGGATLTRGVDSLIRGITRVEPGYAEFSSRDRSPRHDKIMYNIALGAGMWGG